MIKRQLELTLKSKDGKVENVYSIEMPTVHQMWEIESKKIKFSKGCYKDWVMTGTKWMLRSLDYVDMCSYFSTLCPKLIEDEKIDISKMDILDLYGTVMTAYRDQFTPWWAEYEKLVSKEEDELVSND